MRSLIVRGLTAGVALLVPLSLLGPADGAPASSAPPASPPTSPRPGAAGAGDAYFPRAGNGGYDVRHYGLALDYRPSTGVLRGRALVQAEATQSLSRFDLDLAGMTVDSVAVDGQVATWARRGGELVVTPRRAIAAGRDFAVAVRYHGVPLTGGEAGYDGGFLPTEDGVITAGQPLADATWYPASNHPSDAATYTFEVTTDPGREVFANGRLVDVERSGDSTTWTWSQPDPQATYVTTVDIGDYTTRRYRSDGRLFHDGISTALPEIEARPSSGTHLAISGQSVSSHQRLLHEVDVPAGGATVAFDITRNTEEGGDFAFVEVHTVGQDDWTTLPDVNGHTSQDTGFYCGDWPTEEPFLAEHYVTADPETGECAPTGPTGEWHAANGTTGGEAERWQVDLSAYAGSSVEVSITLLSDYATAGAGIFVDDVVVSTGQGTTSFEDGLDGWTVPGPPPSYDANADDWRVGTVADLPDSQRVVARRALSHQPRILRYLSSVFGPYPGTNAGGVVVSKPLGFALETQSRPIYEPAFFTDPVSADTIIVHENAHQWWGDRQPVRRWRNVWLNEGFATYAEWLWSEHEGLGTTQELADYWWSYFPEGSRTWKVRVADPGVDDLFQAAVYYRGALAIHALRLEVGGRAFFKILEGWPQRHPAGTPVTIAEFKAYAEKVSGRQLDELFQTYLVDRTRPPLPTRATPADSRAADSIPLSVAGRMPRR